MKDVLNLQGTWEGEFMLGKGFRERTGDKSRFEMIIQQTGDQIEGYAQDKAGAYVNPDPASLNGFVMGNEITFIKQYPSRHFPDKQGETVIDRSRKGPEIKYKGIINADGDSMHGTWLMKERVLIFGLIPWTLVGRGSWNMRKVTSQSIEH